MYEILCFIYLYIRCPGHGQISPVLVTVSLTYANILVLLSHIRIGRKVIYSLQIFGLKFYMDFSSPTFMLHALPIISCFVKSPQIN
jgi:hypothetical protein